MGGGVSLWNSPNYTYNPPVTPSHVKIGLTTLAVALVLGLPAALLSNRPESPAVPVEIAVDHTEPLTITIERLMGQEGQLFDISRNGSGEFAVHLPTDWSRIEVRGVPLTTVTSTDNETSYRRWVIPQNATVRFEANNVGTITLHNPSGIPLTVKTTLVRSGSTLTEHDAQIVVQDPYVLP